MSEALLYLNEPQTVTQWKGAGHDPVSTAESLYIDDLTGDIVVTSLVGANAAKGRVSYSQARFFAGEGACGSPKTQYSGECTSSSSVVTTPSRLITTVTIGCRSGQSRAIVAARRFPRPILMRSGATNASPVSTSSSSATTPAKTFSSSIPNSAVQYEPAYLVAVSLDTRTIRFYAAPPQRNLTNDTKGTSSNSSGRSPNGDDGFSQLYFTVNLGAYTCCPNSLRFRGDFYHIRHFYWASNSVRQEHGSATSRSETSSSSSTVQHHTKDSSRGDNAMVLVSSALDVNENLSRNFYVRSKLLLGGGGMIVPSPPEVSDAAIRRTVGGLLSSAKDGEENVDEEPSPSRSQPSSPLYADTQCGTPGAAAAGFSTRSAAVQLSFPTPNYTSSSPSNAYLEAVERRSGVALSSQVSRLHSSLQRDHMMVVFTEISVDLVFVDFKSSGSSSSPTKNTSSASSSTTTNTGKSGAQAATADGSSGSAALGQASRSGCEGMVVVLRRIPTRIDFWHTCPSLHVSVVINHLKPTNVKPIAELGGFTWIMPQFKIAGLQPIPLPSTASTNTHHTTTATTRAGNKLGSPFYIADMQVPGAVPSTSQQLPSSSFSTSFARPPPVSYYFPLQILHVYGHVYLAFVDYSRGVVVLYRYQHNNTNGSVVDMAAAMQRAAERLPSREKEQQSAVPIPALGAQQQATDSSLTGSKGNLTPASALRYYTSTSQHADPNQQQFANNSSLFQYNNNSNSLLVHNNSNLGGSGTSPSTMFPSSYAYRNDTNSPSSLAAFVPPTTKLSAYALDPYKKAKTVTHVASLISEGQPMPPTVLLEEKSGGEGTAFSPFAVSAEAFSPPLTGEDNPNFLGVNVGSAYYGGGNSPRTSVNMTAVTSTNFGGSRAFAAEPSSAILSTAVVFGNSSDNPSSVSFVGAVAGESSYLPLSDAVANAVGALERASLPTTGTNSRTGSAANNSGGAGVGTGGSGNSTSSVPSTVQSTIFTGVANASANNFAFAPNGSLVHTFSNVADLGHAASGSGGCCTWEVAYVLPLPALSIVSALRSEWYYGADIAASYRWFTSTSAVKGGLQRSSHSPALTNKKMPSNLAAASSSAAEAPLVALGLGSPILLQTSPDGLIYAHFPDVRPPPDNEVSRGACHLVTAYDITLAVVEGSVAGMACGDLSGAVSHQRALVVNAAPNIYGDPHTVERATQSVADAYEAFSMSNAQHASLSLAGLSTGEGEGRIGRGTELLLAPEGGLVSCAISDASPEASPSPLRATSQRGGEGGGGPSHNSIHGISAFRALASVSSYFTASGSRPESADESLLSPEELLLLRKQQWIRHVTQMRVSEVSSERYVDVGSDSDCTYRRSCAIFASDTLWREMLQYLCARPHPDGGSMSNSPSLAGGPHPSISAPYGRRTLDGGLLVPGVRPSDGEGQNKAKSAGGGGWFKNLFTRASDGVGGKGNGGKPAEETDAFPYAPVVHHLPLDVLTSPFDGSIRVAIGCSSPLLALAPPSPHQPFVVSTVRHNAFSMVTRFDCFSEEIWGLSALRQGMVTQYSSLMPRKGAQPDAKHDVHNLTSPSRAHSAGFFIGGAGGGTNLSSSTGGIRLRRPHFGPGGHYQRSLCFAAQFVLSRRAHMISVAGDGGAVSVPPSSVVLDSVSVVRSVLLRSLATLESQAVIGRLFDVIVAHHCSNLESAAWYRYWRNRWEPLQVSNPSSPLHPQSTSALSSPITPNTKISQDNKSPMAEQPTTLSDLVPAGLTTTDMAARLRITAGPGATLDASVAEYARFARTYAQPHLWPVNTPARMTPLDPIVLSYATSATENGLEGEKYDEEIDTLGNDCSNQQRSAICVEIAVVPAAMDASLVYESVIVPMLQQLEALSDSSSPARSAVAVVSPQAAQAGYSFFKAYVLSSLFEYCRSTVQHGLTITVPLQSSLLELLLSSSGSGPQRSLGFGFGSSSLQQTQVGAFAMSERRRPEISPTYSPSGVSTSSLSAGEAQAAYFRLHQLLMYRALEDHIPTAMRLIALQHAYPPAFQMGLDILGRLGAHSIIVQVFIARRMPVRAAKYLLYNKGLGNKSGAISAVGVGTLPSAEDLSNIVAILECTVALHDEERRAVTDTHVPLRPAKPPAVLAHEAAVAKATEEGIEPPEASEDVEALRHIAAVVNYLDRRLEKKKLKYSTQMTTSGALYCNVYTMLVQQWVEVSLRTYNASVAGASSSNNGIRGRYSTNQPVTAATPVSDPAKAYPQLKPFAARYEQLKAGTMI